MLPEPGGLSPLLAAVRDRLEERTGVRYDSVLVNLYPDGAPPRWRVRSHLGQK